MTGTGLVEWYRMEKADGSDGDLGVTCSRCHASMFFRQAPFKFFHACGQDEYQPPVGMWQNLTTAELPRRKPMTVVAPAITFLPGVSGNTEYTPELGMGLGGPDGSNW
jgi:hypothetical protein